MEQLVKHCIPWEGLHTGTGEEHKKKGAAETNCCGLTATPFPHPPGLLVEQERDRIVGNQGVKLSLGRKSGVG